MRSLFPLVLLLTAGCADSGATAAAKAEPNAPATSVPKSSEPAPTSVAEPKITTLADPRDNPNRIYQLRELKRVAVRTPKKTIQAWVMDDDSKRQEGMMFLTSKEVKDDEGMLFVFPDEQDRSFWMENTTLALDIVYIGKDGTVRNVGDGVPYSRAQVPSAGKAMYVLELKRGQGAKLGIRKGVRLGIPKGLTGS